MHIQRRALGLVAVVLCLTGFDATAHESGGLTEKCSKQLYISSVEDAELQSALQHMSDCLPENGKLTVFVSGEGGSLISAQAFYDQMHTTGLRTRVRFIAYGLIASASNIVWLAASERIVTPASMFLLHQAKYSVLGEDPELIVTMKELQTQTSIQAVRMSAGKNAANLWEQCFNGKELATAFDGKTAVQNGWATGIDEYK